MVHDKRWLAFPCLVLLLSGATVRASTETASYLFEVSHDDRPIGTHRFEIDRDGGTKRVRSRAEFNVQVLFLSLYRYRHEADEQWEDGCLRRLESRTDDNGRRFEFTIGEQASALRLQRLAPEPGSELLPAGCAGTFAYWDLAQLERGALINSQTGSITPVALTFEGEEQVAGEHARRYRLAPAGTPAITLWYRASDQRWLGLETRLDNGVLRYRPADASRLPDTNRGSGLDRPAGVRAQAGL
jgi:hypothetical protein